MSVLLPGTDAYEAVRRPPLGLFHHVRPQVIARCTTPADVAEAIAFARRGGLELAVRSGGHCFAGRSSTEGMLIDVAPINGVVVGDGVATIGAGARLGDVYDALERARRGDRGRLRPDRRDRRARARRRARDPRPQARADQRPARRGEVVLADGRVVDCDEQRHADLFWALRGAGGCQFGVVTELTLRTVPAPTTTTLHLQWPYEDAVAIADAWQAWAPEAPDELAASLLVTAGPDPAAPPRVHVFGALLGTRREAAALLEPSPPSRRPPTSTSSPTGRPSAGSPSTGPATRRRASTASPSRSSSGARCRARRSRRCSTISPPTAGREKCACSTSRRGAGRTTASPKTPPPSRTAASASCSSTTSSSTPARPPSSAERARDWLARSWELVHPWGSGRVYPNFPDPELDDWPRAYHAGNLERLERVKAAYDPDDTSLGCRSPTRAGGPQPLGGGARGRGAVLPTRRAGAPAARGRCRPARAAC